MQVLFSALLTLLLLLPLTARASDLTLVTAPAPLTPAAAAPETYPPQPAMFVIKSDTATVYLFGSAHIIDPEAKWRTFLFDEALARADTIWLESTTLEMANPALMIDEYRSATNDDKSITELLTPEEFQRLDKAAKSQGVDIMDYSHLHPWVISDILTGAQYKKDVQKDASKKMKITPGVENIIEAMAIGKPIKALENTRRHVLLFSSLSPEDEKALLMNTVDEIEKSKRPDIDAVKKAWSTGDLDAMNRLGNDSMEQETPGLFQAMMVRRNQEMADGIIKQLRGTGTNFVAVGALHLAGEKHSVITLLRQAGYAPQRIYDAAEPIASTTHRKPVIPHYRAGLEITPYLNVSLRKDPDVKSGKMFIHLGYPRVIHGCVELSPVIYRIQRDEDGLNITTGGFILNIHPWPTVGGCGPANKTVQADIPLDINEMKTAKTKAIRLNYPGGIDQYELAYADGTFTLTPPAKDNYYRPELKKLTLSGY